MGKKKAKTRGGRRAGAGRKPVLDSPEKASVVLPGAMLRAAKARAEREGKSLSELVREALGPFLNGRAARRKKG